ncbi:MAG: polysaccharide deacetylase family protein [Promethearchaeota archaeon]
MASSLIEKLGFEPTDKVVIFHIDDIGFSHSSNVASFECLDFGVASCGSIIVPAPWFNETVAIYKKNPKYDVGVHLTLTCEYERYRWRALSSVDPKSGLLAPDRALWKTAEEAIQNVPVEVAEQEMRAQIQMALDSGIDITHIDSHMGTVMDPKYLPTYLKLAREFGIAAFFPQITGDQLRAIGLGDQVDVYLKLFEKLRDIGIPIIDHIIIDTLYAFENKVNYYCELFKQIKPGVTHFLFHPAKMTEELKAIVPETADARNQDYEAFTNPRIKECVRENDLKIIGYRHIRETLE